MKLFWIKISRRQGQEPQGLPVSGGWEELTLPVKYSKGLGSGMEEGPVGSPVSGYPPYLGNLWVTDHLHVLGTDHLLPLTVASFHPQSRKAHGGHTCSSLSQGLCMLSKSISSLSLTRDCNTAYLIHSTHNLQSPSASQAMPRQSSLASLLFFPSCSLTSHN